MAVWVIGDLHLSFGVPDKKMNVFGSNWDNHEKKIADFWHKNIHQEDLILIPGDISWAMKLEQALPDLQWIDALPGTKILLRGNHDYWWAFSKIKKILPPSLLAIHNSCVNWNNLSIAGTRLWDSEEYNFNDVIDFKPRNNPKKKQEEIIDHQKIFQRELIKLEIGLKELNQKADKRIVMTHYPPIGLDLKDSQASKLLEKYHVDICVFGHLHSVFPNQAPFGKKNGVHYILASSDYLDFKPLRIL